MYPERAAHQSQRTMRLSRVMAGIVLLLAACSSAVGATSSKSSVHVVPLAIQVQLPPKTKEEEANELQDRAERIAADRDTAHTNHLLVVIGSWQLVVFALQLMAFAVQAVKLNETVRAAREQSDDMRKSVEHAARGASAMESVASAMVANVQNTAELLTLQRNVFTKQLRAYLVPILQGHVAENRDKNLRHEIQVSIKNAGNTPAHAIRVTSRVKVLPVPLPADADFSLPVPTVESYGLLATQDTFYVRSWLDDFLSESENEAIKNHHGSGLYVFGVIIYKDIFEEEHVANFCKIIGWNMAGAANWVSIPARNEAT